MKVYLERSFHVFYFHFPAHDYELDRLDIELGDIIGQGQFGDVHQGVYTCNKDKEKIPVAVKTCKMDADANTADRILEEACKYFFYRIMLMNDTHTLFVLMMTMMMLLYSLFPFSRFQVKLAAAQNTSKGC